MKKAALAALLLVVLVPLQTKALDTEELLGLVAMPLAVAAASEVTGVPVGDLSHFVATLNRAQVPPTQIVQVVRYAPAALVIEDQQPTFVEYVDYEVDRGVIGPQLVTVIEERYRTYDLEPQFLTFDEPATTYVVRDDFIPELVVTRVSQVRPSYVIGDTNDLLALAAMPLAVAAVADITGIPLSDLSSLVASLNAARMPPMQVVEVLRYSPVVLVDDVERPRFVQFVNTQVVDGLTGTRLVNVIDDRLRTYDVTPRFDRVVTVVDDDDFFPPIVTTRVAEVRAHPHGGPPGQLKKQLGLQTGAEVVHGTRSTRSSRGNSAGRVTARSERSDDDARVVRKARSPERKVVRQRAARSDQRVEKPRVERPKSDRKPKVERQRNDQPKRIDQPKPDRGRSDGAAGGKNQGQGKGKGKGKG
jgi:hypothetical protein